MTKIHHTRGVYLCGDYKDNGVKEEDLKDHIDYNLKMRPGRAFFVDGECLNTGYLSDEDCAKISEELKANPIKMNRCTAPYQ